MSTVNSKKQPVRHRDSDNQNHKQMQSCRFRHQTVHIHFISRVDCSKPKFRYGKWETTSGNSRACNALGVCLVRRIEVSLALGARCLWGKQLIRAGGRVCICACVCACGRRGAWCVCGRKHHLSDSSTPWRDSINAHRCRWTTWEEDTPKRPQSIVNERDRRRGEKSAACHSFVSGCASNCLHFKSSRWVHFEEKVHCNI